MEQESSVGSHLSIPVEEYDARIRTFVPGYEEMVAAAARALTLRVPSCELFVELGPGTGTLMSRCLERLPGTKGIGIEQDAAILALARRRLSHSADRVSFVHGSFLDVAIPSCNAVIACLALHHVHSRDRKQALYHSIREAIGESGALVTADCFPSRDAERAQAEHARWRAHLRQNYSEAETAGYFASWAGEDTYFPFEDELDMMRSAGFQAEAVWRQAPMGVIVAAPAG